MSIESANSFKVSEETRQRYLKRRHEDLKACQQAIISNDFQILLKIGHQMKGNASSFGFGELGQIGFNLELYAKSEDLENLAKTLQNFEEALRTLPVYFS